MERTACQEKHPGASYALRFTLFGLLPLLIACSPLRSVRVKGVPPLNVNDSGVSTPVKVRIYQLKDDANFRNARFEELYDDHKKALGGDILDFKEVDIEPGDDRDIELGKIETHTRFIALLGLFNGTGRGDWRQIVKKENAGDYVYRVTGYQIDLQSKGGRKPPRKTYEN